METSPLICSANQWTGFYVITAPAMEELISSIKLEAKFGNEPFSVGNNIQMISSNKRKNHEPKAGST